MTATLPAPLLTVVVATRNEAGNVTTLWDRVGGVLGDVDFEVCYVDDSDDGATRVELAALTAAHPARVRAIMRDGEERRGGLSTALSQGFRAARGRYVMSMDCDLQHPPEAIPSMLAAAECGADIVVGSRYMPGGDPGGLGGRSRLLASRGSALLAKLLFREARSSSDPGGGFFLCRRSVIDGVEFRPIGFKYLLEVLVCIPGLRVVDVPIVFGARTHGESKATVAQGVQFLRHLLSLFLHVRGSARGWKFSLVGLGGLLVFLGLLDGARALLSLSLRESFALAFCASFLLNAMLNRVWTCADVGRAGTVLWAQSSAVSAAAMSVTFWPLVDRGVRPELAAIVAATLSGAVRAAGNRAVLRRRRSRWMEKAGDPPVEAHLRALARTIGAGHVAVLDGDGAEVPAGVGAEAVALARRRHLPVLLAQAASARPQRRRNLDTESAIAVPVRGAGRAVVLCMRRDPVPFTAAHLDRAVEAVEEVDRLLAVEHRAGAVELLPALRATA